jgi:Fe-S cluster assembly protein SufD
MNKLSATSQSFACSISETELPWLNSLKKCGIEEFSKVGLPTLRNEAWRYTSLKQLERLDWQKVAEDYEVGELSWLTSGDSYKLVIVNGKFNYSLSEIGGFPEGAFIGSLSEALVSHSELLETHLGRIATSKDSPLLALNASHMADGYVILLSKVELTKPIEILNVGRTDGQAIAYHPRNLILLDQLSRATIFEHYTGQNAGSYFMNSGTEIFVDQGSHLQHHRIFADGPEAIGVASTGVRVGSDANYTSLVLSDGGKLLRNDVRIHLSASGAETKLGGIYLADDEQHVDHTVVIEHEMPHTKSEQLFKGVLSGKARGVFQGNIKVHEGADGSDGQLLLSPGTEVNSKPQLEIYADDVKCSHGSAVGQLDEEELFYLRSRGIPYTQAKSILVESFLSEFIDEFNLGELADTFHQRITDWIRAD